MTTIASKIESLLSATDSMSNFKNEPSERGQEIYKEYQDRIPVMIAELRELGVSEDTHPKFSQAVIQYNYWK